MEHFVGQLGSIWEYDVNAPFGDKSGMGQVFEGLSESQERVAIKRILLDGSQKEKPSKIPREIEIGMQVNSLATAENLVRMLDWGEADEHLFIAMPRAEGSLTRVLSSKTLTEVETIEILKQIARGLMDLASISIAHRDLKPANILDFGETWKLADFGISRDMDGETATLTYKGFGTYEYMAPEIWELRTATVKSDLYALGVIAFELLEGARPFLGPQIGDFSHQHRTQAPPEMTISSPGIRILVLRLLSKDPRLRPQDAREVLDELNRLTGSGRPNLASIQMARAERQTLVTAKEAEQAAANAKYVERIQLEEGARAELDAILNAVVEEVKEEVQDLEFLVDARGHRAVRSKEFSLNFALWDILFISAIDRANKLILAGALYIQTMPDPVANFVCELDNGRHKWKIQQFRASDGIVEAEYEATDGFRGFSKGDYESHRPYMLRSQVLSWKMISSDLNIDNLKPIIAIAILQGM